VRISSSTACLKDARVVLPGGCCDFCGSHRCAKSLEAALRGLIALATVALVTRVLRPHCGAECR